MTAADDFAARLANALGSLLQPLTTAASQLANGEIAQFSQLVADLGWPLQPGASASAIQAALGSWAADLVALSNALTTGDPGQLASAVSTVVASIPNLSLPPSLTALPAPLNQASFWSGTDPDAGSFAQELFDYLVCAYLSQSLPLAFAILRSLNVVREESVPADPVSGRCAYLRRRIDLGQLMGIIENPATIVQSLWATTPFDPSELLLAFGSAVNALGLRTFMSPSNRAVLYYPPSSPALLNLQMLAVPLYGAVVDAPDGTTSLEVSINLMPVPPPPGPNQLAPVDAVPTGLSIFPEVEGDVALSIALTDELTLAVQAGFTAAPLSIDMYPDQVTAGPGMEPTVDNQFSLTFMPASPFVVIGEAGGTCFSVSAATLTFSLAAKGGSLECKIGLQLSSAQLEIDLSDADNFLTSVLGSSPTTVPLSFGVSWSSIHGFQLSGQAALSVSIPVQLNFADVVSLQSIFLALASGGSSVPSVTVGLSGGLTLGPFSIVVDKVGMQLSANTIADANGRSRYSGLSFGFKAPDGLGISFDTSAISGGGYLSFGQNQYTGWAELAVDVLDLKAFGLLETDPVSFLFIIQAGFPPIQLGFGFTLNDVGGLIGVDRSMALDAMRAASRQGTLTSTLFLDDPISQAPQLTSIVNGLFPIQQGSYVFGLMCEIGWGTPTLIDAELGILIQLPEPVRIAIIGGITCALPDQDAALILINLDVLGTIDFGAQRLSIDATLYNSHILTFSLAGDMSFRLSWGAQPSFALAIGGFNPKFQPPLGFPSPMTRMTCSIGDGQNPYLGVTGYIAVTSNSLQFGAQVELFMSSGSFSVHGYLGFDALFIVAPKFSFVIEIYAGVDLLNGSTKLFCVDLYLALSGPTPWNAQGTASFSICGFSVSFGVNVTWGSSTAALAPVCDTIGPLKDALSAPSSWQSVLPPGADVVASFVAWPACPNQPAAAVLLHPMGLVQVAQTVLPLGTQIQKFGNGTPANADYFAVSAIQAGQPEGSASLNAEFAKGQFFILTDDQKLTEPSFVPYPSGTTFGSTAFSVDPTGGVADLVAYQDFIVDDPVAPSYQLPQPDPSQVVADPLARSFVAGRELGTIAAGRTKYAARPFVQFITVEPITYVVANTISLTQATGIATPSAMKNDVMDELSTYLAAHPGELGQWQVIPAWEVQPG